MYAIPPTPHNFFFVLNFHVQAKTYFSFAALKDILCNSEQITLFAMGGIVTDKKYCLML